MIGSEHKPDAPCVDAETTGIGAPCDGDTDAGTIAVPGLTGSVQQSYDPAATIGPLPDTLNPTAPHAGGADGPLVIGQTFGRRYHIIRLLGVGGMGAVYQAWDQELAVAVALKVVRPEIRGDATTARDLERRFKQELLLARQVTHKNVVRIHDLGEIDGIKYITMSYIDGVDLSTVLEQHHTLDVRQALAIARQIVAGLVAAHEAGVVHRDLKPANVMLDGDRAVIMDFGIARTADTGAAVSPPPAGAPPGRAPARDAMTAYGTIVGTIEYMAPEQARGERVDARVDLYAFGLILRDLLVGRRRYAGRDGAWHELQARMAAPLSPVRATLPAIPETIDAIIARCTQPAPDARYQSAVELMAALDRLDADGVPLPEPRRFGRRHAVAALLLVTALVAGTWWLARPPVAPPAHEPVSVLVADLVNRTGDAAFTGPLEQALTVGLEGASFVTSYPRDAARRLARTIRPDSSLDEAAARLVSVREGIKIIVTGSVARDGDGYAVTVRAEDPTNGKALAAESAHASSRDDVLRVAGTLAGRLRTALGDTTPESARRAAAETFTAASLDAARDFSDGQDLASSGRDEDALAHYQRAVQKDPQFGRAFASWAVSAAKLGRADESGLAFKRALSLLDRMTDREKYRTLGGYYLLVTRNYAKAVENYTTLVNLYPADRAGHSNLALAYFYLLNFPKALAEGRRAVAIYPKNETFRSNYALYAMYAGDFETAAAEARKVLQQNPRFAKAYLVLATAALARGDPAAADEAYRQMAATGPFGASLSAMGRADVAAFAGRTADARQLLAAAIPADRTAKNTTALVAKLLALGDTFALDGNRARAAVAAADVLKQTGDAEAKVGAARLLMRAGRLAEARAVAATLGQELQVLPRAYAKVIEGEIALQQSRPADAVSAFIDAQKLADVWLARYDLGQAYVEAGHYAEAIAELEIAQKRRGEATAIFLDDVPSFRCLAALPYWLARAQEGLGMTGPAAKNYKTFLALRDRAVHDPLTIDARKRLGRFE